MINTFARKYKNNSLNFSNTATKERDDYDKAATKAHDDQTESCYRLKTYVNALTAQLETYSDALNGDDVKRKQMIEHLRSDIKDLNACVHVINSSIKEDIHGKIFNTFVVNRITTGLKLKLG